MRIVCDASPVIALALCDKLAVLDKLFDDALIPLSVFNELTVPNKHAADKIALWARGRTVEASDKDLVRSFSMVLDAGEAEAIALYKEKGAAYLLIDEKKGRKIASRHGVKIIGTLGVLLAAKEKGLLELIKPSIEMLQKTPLRISDALFQKALDLAGE
jgi:predicted nucleic acid-binding protein